MKRERASVWKDDDDEVVNTKMEGVKRYGRKPASDVHTTTLRAEFQYVTDNIFLA
jgi:hypothetical protein